MDIATPCCILAASSVGLVILRECYLWLRVKFPASVNCWFCHKKSKVHYLVTNSWICKHCEQYNGFTSDGDYNKVILRQHEEKLNFSVTSIGRKKKDWKLNHSLCDTCNRNQELKVKQLASFVPINEKNYDKEVDHYRNQLEKSYKLCPNCEVLVSNVLHKLRDLSGPRRLLNTTMRKMQAQGNGVLFVSLVLSLVLCVSSATNLQLIKDSRESILIKKWLEETARSSGWAAAVRRIIPEYIDKRSLQSIPIGIVICGAVLQTLNYFRLKTVSCFLNWCFWVCLVVLTFFPNSYINITHLQVTTGVVTFILTLLIILQNRSKSIINAEKKPKRKSSPIIPPRNSPVKPNPFSEPISPPPPSFLKQSFSKNDRESLNVGLSKLNLGPTLKPKKHEGFLSKRPEMARKVPIISPSKLNLDKSFEKPLSRTNSYSSGFVSLSGNSDRSSSPSLCDDYDQSFERPVNVMPYARYSPNSAYDPQPLISPFTYYHFAAQCQRMYFPPLQPLNTSCPSNCHDQSGVFNFWSILYLLPISVLVMSNLAILWTLYSRELMSLRA